ncbi:unnamed protein product [Penicillium salamii]|uniref:Uncharacterized protein n=4 Tax=Penicillium TaxID=5073 RepID=A0A9W4J788_9EURO|nr:unnamed protein product [Penicillium salamii]CAG8086792.1 unnamed protein product [Penicillium salamii]CAG8091889.1 unnamed protein product [Penicillium salamii]CAG8109529.1 unnamed protein product [Penicillium salamii]CAG8129271.1 unnamed protein product [Penicillium salamii]
MVSILVHSGLNTCIFLISGSILLKLHSFVSVWFMMKAPLTFRRAQKLTQELQRVLEEDPPQSTTTSTRTKLSSNVLEPAFEWDRNRRSAAPSPELLPGHESQELSGSMLGEANPGRLDILVPSVGKQTDCRCCDAGSLTSRVALLAVRGDI